MLKVLIIDDCSNKIKNISKLLIEKCNILENDINVAHDTTTGRKELQNSTFDILILDMNLPESISSEPSKDGGIKFLEKIHTGQISKYPEHIIAITGFEEIINNSKKDLEKYLTLLIHYDNTSTEWQDKIIKKVNYIVNSKQNAYGNCFEKFDIAVITALKAPELDAVLSLPYEWETLSVPNDDTVNYHKGIIKNGENRYSIIVANAPIMGMVSSSILATKMCFHFHPKYFFMTGICAGVKGKNEYGDILVAEKSWDWGSGKITENFEPDHNQIKLDTQIVAKLNRVKSEQSNIDNIKNSYKGSKPSTSLNLHIGAIASGASVLENIDSIKNIKNFNRKLIGIEMEIYGVMSAIEYSINPKPKAICIKSVCDFADEEKSDDWQHYASYTSAKMMDLLIRELDFCN